jgi:hypothetical protein
MKEKEKPELTEAKAKVNVEPLVMPLTWLTVVDDEHNVLISGAGDFKFVKDEKVLLNDKVTIFLNDKEPIFDTSEIDAISGKSCLKFYPESQPA